VVGRGSGSEGSPWAGVPEARGEAKVTRSMTEGSAGLARFRPGLSSLWLCLRPRSDPGRFLVALAV